jgi:hypothetical protein
MINNYQGGQGGHNGQGGAYMHNQMGDPSMQPMNPGYGQHNMGMGQPMMGQPMMGQPMMGQPMMGQPMMGQPMMGGQMGGPHGGLTGIDPGQLTVEQIWSLIPQGIFVKQKFDILEAMTGCDTPNRYYVFEQNPSGGAKKKKIFKCKEKSGWCSRQYLSSDCKPFDMEIKKCFKDEDFDSEEVVIRLERDCQCTCYCCNRPEMKVFCTERGQKIYIGKVVDNYDFCNYSYTVYDSNDHIRFFIKASCCQLGFCCKCPCEACEKIEFDLWSGDKEKPEPPIMKTGAGSCIKNAMGSADQFAIGFPMAATWQDKTLLLAAVLMIDFMQFEEKNGGKGGNSGVIDL